MAKNQYGYTYTKQGNLVVVNPPRYANGKEAKKHTKTLAGGLHDSVGFARPGSENRHANELWERGE